MKVWVLEESVAGEPYRMISIHMTKESAEKRKQEQIKSLHKSIKGYYDYDIEEHEVEE